jgi:hypothetical protein
MPTRRDRQRDEASREKNRVELKAIGDSGKKVKRTKIEIKSIRDARK